MHISREVRIVTQVIPVIGDIKYALTGYLRVHKA